MRKKAWKTAAAALAAAAMIWTLTGCGQRTEPETEARQTESETESETETESEALTEEETEAQNLITSVEYTSKDGSVKITLPDNTWKVTQDVDEMRVFQSEPAAIINIVHAATESAMKNLSVMTNEQALRESLAKQYSGENDYDIEDFITTTVGEIQIYRYVVKYNAAARMWAYSVTNAVVGPDEAYVVTGTVTDDNETLLRAVRKAVESFAVTGDEAFKAATGAVLSGTTQKTTEESESELTGAAAELSTLTDYGTTAQLVTNDTVNVRLSPGTDANILTTLNGSTSVSVIGETKGWFKVNINGNVGYIRKDFLVYPSANTTTQESETTASSDQNTTTDNGSGSSAELSTATSYGGSTTLYASGDANVRSAPGTDSGIINAVGAGAAVTVTGETDNWFIVSVGGTTGYISKALLTNDSSAASNNTGSGSGSGSDNGGSTGGALTSVSGTVTSAGADTLTITTDSGSSYTIYYGDASVATADGLYSGAYVNVSLDPYQAPGNGTLYATSVSG